MMMKSGLEKINLKFHGGLQKYSLHEPSTDLDFFTFQTLYRLNVSQYHGDAGDSMSHHSGAAFSTTDKGQKISKTNFIA